MSGGENPRDSWNNTFPVIKQETVTRGNDYKEKKSMSRKRGKDTTFLMEKKELAAQDVGKEIIFL